MRLCVIVLVERMCFKCEKCYVYINIKDIKTNWKQQEYYIKIISPLSFIYNRNIETL